jgi:hypothetical protein
MTLSAPLFAHAEPAKPEVKLGVGYSYLELDRTKFSTVTDFFVTSVIGHEENHDGRFDGYRLTGEITGLLPGRLGAFDTSFGVKGFYSAYSKDQNSRCAWNAFRDCAFLPFFDPDVTQIDLSGGFFSDWRTRTSRHVDHYGGAIEVRLDRGTVVQGGLKDAPQPVPSPFQVRFGLAARRLDQKLDLISTDVGVTADPVTLNEVLDATYFGGYAGFTASRELFPSTRLIFSTDAGLYHAQADYQGRYTATASLGGGPRASSIALSTDKPAFIGAINLELERELGWAKIALFAEGEWISYVPAVRYNETDLATPVASGLKPGSTIFDLTGRQNGTALGESTALTYTVGAKVSIPLR